MTQARLKDEVTYFMISQVDFDNGITLPELIKWGIFPRTFLLNSLKRLHDSGRIQTKKVVLMDTNKHEKLMNLWSTTNRD